jgi:hypothetical protein
MAGLLANNLRSSTMFGRPRSLQFQFLLPQHFHFLLIASAGKKGGGNGMKIISKEDRI